LHDTFLAGDRCGRNCYWLWVLKLNTRESIRWFNHQHRPQWMTFERLIPAIVLPARDCDKALKSVFGSGSKSQCENVMEMLNIYIEELRVSSNKTLA
jgi:hypothetical protein